MNKLRTTPAAWMGVAETDPRESRLNTSTALAVIIGGYLCFFAAGITNALYAVGTLLNPVDYSTPRQVGVLTLRVGEIAGALVLFFLVRQWLNIPVSLTGTPRRRTSPLPSLATIAIFGGGYILGGLILNALSASNANAAGGGVVPNVMAWVGGPVTGVNAGIVEEIVIVAIPVLLGCRAGWHPLAIVALSCFLRWPFHIYHDTWATIPWAALWGGANCAAYLYLRRLAPLVLLHATIDTAIDYGSAFGTSAALIPVFAAGLALGILMWRILAARTRQLTPGMPTVRSDPAAARYLLQVNRRRYRRAGAGWVLFVLTFTAYTAVMYGWTATAVVGGLLIAVITLGYAAVRTVFFNSNVHLHRDENQKIVGGITWHTTAAGRSYVDERVGQIDQATAVAAIAHAEGSPVNFLPTRTVRGQLAERGHRTRRWGITMRVTLTPAQAESLITPVSAAQQ